jgi:hypothetical protein
VWFQDDYDTAGKELQVKIVTQRQIFVGSSQSREGRVVISRMNQIGHKKLLKYFEVLKKLAS